MKHKREKCFSRTEKPMKQKWLHVKTISIVLVNCQTRKIQTHTLTHIY